MPPGDKDMDGDHDLAAPADGMTHGPDLAKAEDMAGPPADLSGGDMSKPADLSGPPADMAGPHVTGLPTCTDVGVNADAVFTGVAQTACAGGVCHGGGAGSLKFTSSATFKSALVGVASTQTTTVPLVTAGDVDRSYLIYKLVNEQGTVGGRGGLMPKGGARLADAQLCKFIVWIKEGAN